MSDFLKASASVAISGKRIEARVVQSSVSWSYVKTVLETSPGESHLPSKVGVLLWITERVNKFVHRLPEEPKICNKVLHAGLPKHERSLI
jgi:hypothetical protein